ncbi:GvpL/GvpF family gas vesicle protein [Georgenia sp. SUBG003]|uniref:GvpL/GvpF family gas vesicle protein n=1 Tax=Georgenia sp. SUBG003 TaxID=1497974 RepID=UPI0004D5F5B4|nr:hypothetical protein DA06_13885 [Georgenia sp. SUBG003]
MTAPAAEEVDTLLYVYGLVLADADVPEGLEGVGGERVHVVGLGDVAALVSELPGGEVVGLPAEVRAHAGVLDTVAAAVPVLPMRFGTAVPDVDAIDEAVPDERLDGYAVHLRNLADVVQFTVRAQYVEQAVLTELVSEEPEIRELREATRDQPEDATYYARIRLGELVVQGFERKREADAAQLLEAVTPWTSDLRTRETGQVDDVLEAAALVRRGEQDAFEEAVDALATRTADRIVFRLIGPQAPYDFVPED